MNRKCLKLYFRIRVGINKEEASSQLLFDRVYLKIVKFLLIIILSSAAT